MTVEKTLLQERLISIIRRFPQRRIVVIGDSVADQFVFGAIGRVSREAPVLILRHEQTETVPGGAANCALNLASLGAKVSLVSVAGDDEAGRALVEKLKAAGVDCSGVFSSPALRTTTKVRILAGQLHSTRQQVIRIDYEDKPLSDPELRERLRERIREEAQVSDAMIISDYNYGVADAEMASFTREAAAARKLPVMADSRFQLSNFAGFTSATPNQDEVEQLLGKEFNQLDEFEAAAEELRERLGYRALLVTRGSHGMMLLEDGVAPVHLEAVGAREPVDVTGAGDTVMAAYTLALASDSSFPDAARVANYAGGLVVMKRGTASVTREELETSILHSEL
ncbi:MAG TPA: PfkB family carbohydrate kinase [Pyrinomonadaceae bacterium]|nr:PfkB family carbohydrate kinase [Pyrinomonadaceae bacterium]